VTEQPTTSEPAQSKRIEFKRPGYQLVLEISPDADLCVASYEPVAGGAPLTRGELESYLGQLKISEGIVTEAITALTLVAVQGKPLYGATLASGTPMIPGAPGRIVLAAELTPTPESTEPPPMTADGEPLTVDFHHVQDFVNVDAGGLIGTVEPPGAGTPGRSILGGVIPPRAGKAFALKLGKNVRLDADGTSIYAEMAGRVTIRGEEVSVEEIYQVAGDVNFKIGNIDFNGAVEIRGDVLDGFRVKAKEIKVQGNVGVCHIEASGNISLCGMNGQGKGTIVCGGNLSANFIYETDIECAGDLLVESEIRSCHIHTLGAVLVHKGGIVGGECVALAGVEAGILGSVTSLHTNIVTGVSYRDLAELSLCFNELKNLVARFNAAQKSSVDPKAFQAERAAITGRIHEIRTRTYARTNPKVNVRKMLYGGVTITLGVASEEFREERPGPMSIIENTIEGGFRFLGLTDLAFSAAAIEATFVQQHQLDAGGKD
jgi:uncharacterized protein (DUF342 family)